MFKLISFLPYLLTGYVFEANIITSRAVSWKKTTLIQAENKVTDSEVGGSEAIAGRYSGCGRGCVSVERIDVCKQCAHDRRDTGTHVLGRQARKMPTTNDTCC